MGNDDAFLRAIAANPADETSRMVYADWLDERGDPRGEYIRIRAEIERAAPHTDQYAALRTRLKALREQIAPAWVKAMGYRTRHRPLFTILPDCRAHRWQLVEEFIETWHRPLGPGDGCPELELRAAEQRLGCKLPAALREWYALAGRRRDVWSIQDRLETPDSLAIDSRSDILIVRAENQGCELWGIRAADLGQDDPPIMEVYAGVQSSPTTTAFACLVLLCESMLAPGVLRAGGGIRSAEVCAAATRGLSLCALPDRYWVPSPVRLFEGIDLIVLYQGDDWINVVARGEEAYRQLDHEVREQLEVYKS